MATNANVFRMNPDGSGGKTTDFAFGPTGKVYLSGDTDRTAVMEFAPF